MAMASNNTIFMRQVLRPLVAERQFGEADTGDNPANLTASRPPLLGLKVLGFVNAKDIN